MQIGNDWMNVEVIDKFGFKKRLCNKAIRHKKSPFQIALFEAYMVKC